MLYDFQGQDIGAIPAATLHLRIQLVRNHQEINDDNQKMYQLVEDKQQLRNQLCGGTR
jgi:hypothetical protein